VGLYVLQRWEQHWEAMARVKVPAWL